MKVMVAEDDSALSLFLKKALELDGNTVYEIADGVAAVEKVSGLHDALSNVIAQRATLNTSQSRLSGESDYITQQKANLQAQQSTLLSADTASLATELSAVTTQRSALLSTIAVVQKGSLFDYM